MTSGAKETSPSIICIMNSSAGSRSGQSTANQIVEMFAKRKIQANVWIAKSGAEIADLSRRAITQRPTVLVAGGGDGTINAVADAVVDTDIILGVLPMGTLNHFARDLKIPADIDHAVEIIATGRVRSVDVGDVNGSIFLNNSSLGLYPHLVRERERLQSLGTSKLVGWIRAVSVVALRFSQLHVRMVTRNKAKALLTTPFLFIGVNQYQIEGWAIGQRLSLDKGTLWLYSASRRGPLGLVAIGLQALLGRLGGNTVLAYETTECWIETRGRAADVARDGEVTRMATPLHYHIRPAALRVMAPLNGTGFND
jgi:diacylglycerol kinase family enzyme